MKAWRRQLRFGIIAFASFVLLVTVLPQVASAVGFGSLANRLAASVSCTGGSGSGSSSQCTPAPGTVTGTVTITGAPAGFVPPYSGAGACPGSGNTFVCANPVYSLASGGHFSMQLAPGTWTVDGFFEINPYGGAFLGHPRVVTVTSGHVFTRNLTVPYAKPAGLTGTITVTGVPKGVTIRSFSILLCPPGAPYTGGPASIACVNGYGHPSAPGSAVGRYTLGELPPVKWLAYPGYCTAFGCTIDQQGIAVVTLLPGRTTTLDLSTPWTTPQNGLLTGTVTVTGAPTGFSAGVGVWACSSQGAGQLCEEYSSGNNRFGLILPDGTWQVTGFYFAAPFNNPIVGTTATVVVKGGRTTTVALPVPYRVLGAAAGSIDVTGLPASVHPTGYTVTACPAVTTPLTGLECVQEFSGVGGLHLRHRRSQPALPVRSGRRPPGDVRRRVQRVPAAHTDRRQVDPPRGVPDGVRVVHQPQGRHGHHHLRSDHDQEPDRPLPGPDPGTGDRNGGGHRRTGLRIPGRGAGVHGRPDHRV